jgi:hypothetical protein
MCVSASSVLHANPILLQKAVLEHTQEEIIVASRRWDLLLEVTDLRILLFRQMVCVWQSMTFTRPLRVQAFIRVGSSVHHAHGNVRINGLLHVRPQRVPCAATHTWAQTFVSYGRRHTSVHGSGFAGQRFVQCCAELDSLRVRYG